MYQELLDYDFAHQALEHLTVARVAHYLTYIFDCGTHEIFTQGPAHKGQVTTTPIDLARIPYLSGCLAARTIIYFWGGPPNEEEWYQGSLLTMLIDKLYYCIAMGFEDVVDKFLGTLNGGYSKAESARSKVAGCA